MNEHIDILFTSAKLASRNNPWVNLATHSISIAYNISMIGQYGYQLGKADKEAIKKHNSMFHGHFLIKQQNEFFGMSRLHKLCAILLLKKAEFTGQVLYNEAFWVSERPVSESNQ